MDTTSGPATSPNNDGDVAPKRGRQLEGEKDVDLELVFQALGTRGRYQILQLSLQIFSSFVASLPTLAVVFIGELLLTVFPVVL